MQKKMSKIIDGKLLSKQVKDDVKNKINEYKQKYNREITLAVVLVGDDPASTIYVKNKVKACDFVGIKSLSFTLPADSSEEQVENLVSSLALDDKVDGILVQLPLPKHISEQKILSLVPVEKDVDGFTSLNSGNLLLGKDGILPCTPKGIIYAIKSTGIDLVGKNAVVLGRSNIVGKPTALLLLRENCTVTVCHSKTQNLDKICKKADVLVVAVGKAKFVKESMVKKGALIIDVGINRTENGLCGDVDFENVNKKVKYISPVPGGIGPMTIAMLMNNTYECALKRVK